MAIDGAPSAARKSVSILAGDAEARSRQWRPQARQRRLTQPSPGSAASGRRRVQEPMASPTTRSPRRSSESARWIPIKPAALVYKIGSIIGSHELMGEGHSVDET